MTLRKVLITFGIIALNTNARLQDIADAVTLGITRKSAKIYDKIPISSLPLDLPIIKNKFVIWAEEPSKTQYCQDFYAKNPVYEARYKAINGEQPSKGVFSLVDHISVLTNYSTKELHCLFAIAYSPLRIPQGIAKGRGYSAIGDNKLNDLIHILWGGKVFFNTKCGDGTQLNLVTNSIFKTPSFYALTEIGEYPSNSKYTFSEQDVWDNRKALWIDYGTDFEDLCPEEIPGDYDTPEQLQRMVHFLDQHPIPFGNKLRDFLYYLSPDSDVMYNLGLGRNNVLRAQNISVGMYTNMPSPINVVDAVRWIGRDENLNIDFYLGRIMLNFYEGLRTIGYYNLKMTDLMDEQSLE